MPQVPRMSQVLASSSRRDACNFAVTNAKCFRRASKNFRRSVMNIHEPFEWRHRRRDMRRDIHRGECMAGVWIRPMIAEVNASKHRTLTHTRDLARAGSIDDSGSNRTRPRHWLQSDQSARRCRIVAPSPTRMFGESPARVRNEDVRGTMTVGGVTAVIWWSRCVRC